MQPATTSLYSADQLSVLQALSDFFDSSDFYDGCDFFARSGEYARDDLFFGREIEHSLLLAQLGRSPTSMLVLVGPYNSGKTRLLREVLTEKKQQKGLVTFVDGRYGVMTRAGEMAAVLRRQGARQLSELKCKIKTSSKPGIHNMIKSILGVKVESPALLPSSVLKTLEGKTPCSIADVIEAYDSLLTLSSSMRTLETSPLPVICIDEANVLTEWREHGDLDALLHFLAKVRVLLCCCVLYVDVTECQMSCALCR